MSIQPIIAIDGPAASGKSTLGKLLADALGYVFLDTGVMYRAVTWLALERGIPLDDGAALTGLAQAADIDVRAASVADGRSADIFINGQDITWAIREPEVEASVSEVSAHLGVRQALTEQQRKIGLRGHVVMVGRDIGTVVLPEAGLKLFLVASVEERARRRWSEQRQRGEPADYQEILAAMRRRDQYDSTRAVAPLKPAEDAILVDSDGLDADQVFQQVMALATDP